MLLRYLKSIFDFKIDEWSTEARVLHWLTFTLLFIGLVTLLSASYPEAIDQYDDGWLILKRQLGWVLVGSVIYGVIIKTSIEQILKFAPWGFFLFFGLIFATLVPGLGTTVNGATRWIFGIQPSELVKPFLVLQSAKVFGKWHRLPTATRTFWSIVFVLMLGFILKQPNLSTTSLCGMTLWLMALAGDIPITLLLSALAAGLSAAYLSIQMNPYQQVRLQSFQNPWLDPKDSGYQLIQSLLAIGSGGVWGSGFGLSQQKTAYLPFGSTDFVFSVYAEEFGLIGSIVLLILLIAYGTLAFLVALKSSDRVHRLIAVGVMLIMVGQSLLHIGVATGALPTTGLPLPLFSYGGSSMIASLTLSGLLVRVARESSQAEVIYLD